MDVTLIFQVYRYFFHTVFWTALLWGASGWLFGQTLVSLVSPKPLIAPAAFSLDETRKITPIGQLLGDTAISKTRFSVNDIQILGLLAQGKKGAVLISIRNGPTKTLTAGARDTEGWMLESVDQGVIRIAHYGSIFELPLPRPSQALQTNRPN